MKFERLGPIAYDQVLSISNVRGFEGDALRDLLHDYYSWTSGRDMRPVLRRLQIVLPIALIRVESEPTSP